MKAATDHPAPHRPGPAPFVCCYINGSPEMPPMLLALDGAADVGHLLSLAGQTLKSAAGSDGGVAPHVAFLPDGTVLPKVTKTSAIAPGSVLVLG